MARKSTRPGQSMARPVREYLANIGAKGGKKSRRELTPEQARAMVKAREAKKKNKIAFDIKRMQPACALLQSALGGDQVIAQMFPSESWLLTPTEDLKLYEVNQRQLQRLIKIVTDKTVRR